MQTQLISKGLPRGTETSAGEGGAVPHNPAPSRGGTRELGHDLGLRDRAGRSDGISGTKAVAFVDSSFAGTPPLLAGKQQVSKAKKCFNAFRAVASDDELRLLQARGANRSTATCREMCRKLQKRLQERFAALCVQADIPARTGWVRGPSTAKTGPRHAELPEVRSQTDEL